MKLYLFSMAVFLGIILLAAQATKSNTMRYKRIFGQGYYHRAN